jgi:3-dehydroquinate dehydratase/shikimate dehydrogenase
MNTSDDAGRADAISTRAALVCVPIMLDDDPGAVGDGLIDAGRAKQLGADLVEYRIDHLFSGEGDDAGRAAVLDLVARSPLPCIVTCRPVYEGGGYDGDDNARISLYEALGTADTPPAYIDCEALTYSRSANLRQKMNLAVAHGGQQRAVTSRLILSHHDFEGRSASLLRIVTDMRRQDAASVLKIAFTARSVRDNLELFDLLRERDRPTVALGMGEDGLMSRVLAPKFGGLLTFASLDESSATASGQPTVDELLNLYRFRSIGPRTKMYGVIGDPVVQSASPAVHNDAFDRAGHDGVYLPLRVAPGWEPFKATLLSLLGDPALHFSGASVTIPHKANLVRLAREIAGAGRSGDGSRPASPTRGPWRIDEMSNLCGAANTIALRDDGSVDIANTDASAIVELLEPALRKIDSAGLRGARVLIVGTGGAARAAAAACARGGAHVTITGRSADKAAALAAELGAAFAAVPGAEAPRIDVLAWDERQDAACDALVQCTPLGMAGGPEPDGAPLDVRTMPSLSGRGVIFETVYNPLETPLVAAARETGRTVITGERMFVRQAAAQSRMWTGDAPDEDAMRAAVLGKLASDA